MWELTEGYVSSLFAVLISAKPIHSLQVAAYIMLSTDPVSQLAITEEDACSTSGYVSTSQEYVQSPNPSLSSDENIPVRDEISRMIIRSLSTLLEGDLISHHRVNVFTAWNLLLSHLQSLASASPARRKSFNGYKISQIHEYCVVYSSTFHYSLVQCIAPRRKMLSFQLVFLRLSLPHKCAISTGSLLFSIESLCPIGSPR
ncbi:hypothetical protein MKW92_049640 [Papaver armeniacum]|nr:hypothetical protein MKW92_049640 [Papaver armeniacum]